MDARYRLAPMRELRARDERDTRGELAGAVGVARRHATEVADAARSVERATAALAAADRDCAHVLARGARGGTIAHLEHYLRRLRRDLDAARAALARAEARRDGHHEVVDAVRERLRHARAAREVIERHFAAWRAERRKLAERRAD